MVFDDYGECNKRQLIPECTLRKLLRKLKYVFWVLNGYLGREIHSEYSQKATVMIASFNPIRMNDLDPQIRNILRCAFIENVIISNHNPEIQIEEMISVQDDRLIIMNQPVRRAGGYRWRIANEVESEYLIIIDDDIFLFPSQLKILFEALVRDPDMPHGFSGLLRSKSGEYRYCENESISVNYLCEVYAVTKNHIKRYFELENLLVNQFDIPSDVVEELGDYILISQAGDRNPVIHNAGPIFRSHTFKTPGIAYHKERQFEIVLAEVSCAVQKIRISQSNSVTNLS